MPEIRVAEDEASLARAAAGHIAATARAVLSREKIFSLVLSGGNTPRKLYECLASPLPGEDIAWPRVHVFWGDERFVPGSDPDHNHAVARALLLSRVPIPADTAHPMPTDGGSLEESAAAYEKALKYFYYTIPRFHVVLLGLGDDGHVASLFPGSPALGGEKRWIVPVADSPKPPPRRLTM